MKCLPKHTRMIKINGRTHFGHFSDPLKGQKGPSRDQKWSEITILRIKAGLYPIFTYEYSFIRFFMLGNRFLGSKKG